MLDQLREAIKDKEIKEENSESEKNDEILYEDYDRWRIGIIYNPDGLFEQLSFVNGICTYHGG